MAVIIHHTKSQTYYTGDGWTKDKSAAKKYNDKNAAEIAVRQHNMTDVEPQGDHNGDDDDAASTSIHETGHSGGDQ